MPNSTAKQRNRADPVLTLDGSQLMAVAGMTYRFDFQPMPHIAPVVRRGPHSRQCQQHRVTIVVPATVVEVWGSGAVHARNPALCTRLDGGASMLTWCLTALHREGLAGHAPVVSMHGTVPDSPFTELRFEVREYCDTGPGRSQTALRAPCSTRAFSVLLVPSVSYLASRRAGGTPQLLSTPAA